MSPTAKDLETSNSQTTARTAGAEEANKPQPVPLEVPVTVNGARTVEGSDKREPFSESTQTVLVFHNGAVIRLSSSVTAGQLLFLTNDKTKKEVVCQVVKSKNYRNVSGYVELEFTEAVAGFWGMRFPGERATAPSAPVAAAPARPAPVTPIAPAAPKVEAPAAANVAPRVEPKPVAPRPAAPVAPVIPAAHPSQPVAPAASSTIFAARPETHAPAAHTENKPAANPTSGLPLPKAPGLTDGWGKGMTSSAPIAVHPPAPSAPKAPVSSVAPPAPVTQISTQGSANAQATTPDALRRESEKLQEQLATMLLGDNAKSVPAAPATPVSKVVDFPRPQSQQIKPAAPAKPTPLTSAEQDEVKIPSWLEPLARNAATHSQNELTAKEEGRDSGVFEFEVQDLSVPSTTKDEALTEADPILETHSLEGADLSAHAPKKSRTVLIGAIAAGLVLAAVGATWYSRNSSGTSSQTSSTTAEAAPAPAVTAAETSAVNASASQPAARPADKTPNRSNINSEPVPVASSAAAQQNAQSAQNGTPSAQLAKGVDKSVSAELNAYKKLAEPIAVAAKRPSLGEVHLSAPKATRETGAVVGEAEALALNSSGQIVPAGDAFGAGLVGGATKQPVAPAAPLPIGGDVKAAHLISSVPPVYPQLAKTQHISGAVLLDALIDVNGRVSSMKVVSGPVLLHQAAMEALRQWKYQAATLDGKPVPMHLTVTIQFRLQ
jgi:TonB family protein